MSDPILAARIDALIRNLACAEKSQDWLVEWLRSQSNNAVGIVWPQDVGKDLSRVLVGTIGIQAGQHIDDLRESQAEQERAEQEGPEASKEALKRSWRRYYEIYDESRKTFGEYLEFIGGLAIRSMGFDEAIRSTGFDERVCQVADELVRSCSKEVSLQPWQSLTIPSLQESLTRTLARIIRLSFPEWTIWMLPFTAHEYGYVVIEDSLAQERNVIKTFVTSEIELLKQRDGGYQAAKDEEEKKTAEARIKNHLLVLLADAFATYTMGPAYAHAAISLRFNPSHAHRESSTHPSEVRRACMVLKMLEEMDKAEGGNTFRSALDKLNPDWKAMLDRAGSSELSQSEVELIEEQVQRIWRAYGRGLLPMARYPKKRGEAGWLVAQDWETVWSKRLSHGGMMRLSESIHVLEPGMRAPPNTIVVTGENNLRDALNAAWLCRINSAKHPGDIDEIARGAQSLCESIIKVWRLQSSASAGQGRQPSIQGVPPPDR